MNGRSKLKALIFDVDGTLYRQSPVRRAMLRRLLGAHTFRPLLGISTLRALRAYRKAQEELRACGEVHTDLAESQLELACRQGRIEPEAMRLCVARWMESSPLDLVAAARFDGLIELLRTAKRRNLLLGVVSDYPASDKLAALEVSSFFDTIVIAQDSDVQRFKPDPRGIEVAVERLGVAKNDVVYVGDRPSVDGEAAQRAGVSCVIINTRERATPGATWSPVADYWQLARNLDLL